MMKRLVSTSSLLQRMDFFLVVSGTRNILSLMAYSHCARTGQVQGTGSGVMGSNILYRIVHTGLRQGKELEPIVSYCAGPVPCSCPPVPIHVHCKCGNILERKRKQKRYRLEWIHRFASCMLTLDSVD